MKPRTKTILKILACHWIASISWAAYAGLFANTTPHVAYASFPPFVILMAFFLGIGIAIGFPFVVFEVFRPEFWPHVTEGLSYLLPLLVTLSLAFKKPRRWYGVVENSEADGTSAVNNKK